MTTFEINKKTYYIDNNLRKEIDEKIIPELSKKDEDVVFIVDGKERSGKSKFADILAGYASLKLKRRYDISNVCMTPSEFRKKVETSKRNEVVIYDEAHRGMGSRRAISEINNILVDLMMEMGQRNLFVIICLPTFFMLDKYPALFRARGLFHIYKKKSQKGFWCYFNEKNKLRLYILGKKLLNYNCMKWPKFRGRFYNQYIVNEKKYRLKKGIAFREKPRYTRAETYKNQRDILFYLINRKFNISQKKISELCKDLDFEIERNTISDLINKKETEFEEEKIKSDNFTPNNPENEGTYSENVEVGS